MAEPEVRQRLAAILAADVAGYSRLMGGDERATIVAINRCRATFREQIEANGGRVVDMAGDSVLAVFDTAIGAFTASVAAQEQLAVLNSDLAEDRRMAWRIGVNTGDIHEQDDGTVYGDGVNVAARLEALAEPGGICLSDKVHAEVRGKLDLAFADLGEHAVKNIAEPVHAYRVLAEGEMAPRSRLPLYAAGAVAVAALAALAIWQLAATPEPAEVAQAQDPILALPSGPSIAVLPFDNLSGDPEQDYFVQGLTQDMITGLARYPDLFVFAFETSSQISGERSAATEAARQLGADFVIRGNVRKDEGTIRVAANLWDVASGQTLWGETYDRDLTARSLFEVQDEITTAVVSTLGEWTGVIQRVQLGRERELPTDSLQAYDCVLRSVEYYDAHTPDKHAEVRDCLERAVEVDPGYSMAWALLSFMYLDESRYLFNPRPNPLDRALEAARLAIELDRDNATAWTSLAKIHFHRHEIDAFLAAADETLKLDSTSSVTLADIGLYLIHSGNTERGMPLVRKAMQLNPKHQSWYWFAPAWYHFQRREYEEALTAAGRINMPGMYWNHGLLASTYGQLGKRVEAAESVRHLLDLYPDFAQNAYDEFRKWNPPPEFLEAFIDGLRKAGLDVPADTG